MQFAFREKNKLATVPGGTWGAKLERPETRLAWIGAFHKMTKDRLAYSKSPHTYNADQKLLERYGS